MTAENVDIRVGDCLNVLRDLPEASVDSIVTDPPYGLTFMGNTWDSGVPSVDVWREALRVLKPGGHLLAFAGTRTQHRMACAIEDAGFEIRDMIGWAYGSGFPKSMNVAKAIDKAAGFDPVDLGPSPNWRESKRDRERSGKMEVRGDNAGRITAPASDAARTWEGWGTALKPAWEPITVARKPLDGTVAQGVLAHGTGALNIDGCRVPSDGGRPARSIDPKPEANGAVYAGRREAGGGFDGGSRAVGETTQGRWPANLIHDGSDEVVSCFPAEAGAAAPVHTRGSDKLRNSYGAFKGNIDEAGSTFRGDTGSAARFFYCAKATKADRNAGLDDAGNIHPTVKPTDLMRYLCRLVTPPGGVVLDPFMGSGSTGRGAVLEGLDFIGIDITQAYVEIARVRISAAQDEAEKARYAAEEASRQMSLFTGRDP